MGWPNAFTSCNNIFCCLAWICLKAISSFKVYGKSWNSHAQPEAGTKPSEAKSGDASDQHWRKEAWCCFDFHLFSFMYPLYSLHTYLELCNLLLYSGSFSQNFSMSFTLAESQNIFQNLFPVLVLRNQALQTHFHQQSTDPCEGRRLGLRRLHYHLCS